MPSKPYKISDLGEKKLIKRLLSKSQNPQIQSLFLNNIPLNSLSDDAALIDIGENYIVLCSDMLLKSSHFPDEMSFKQIGGKVVTVNVSDVAAMGAHTIGIIISMGLPRNMLVTEFDDLVEGILNACEKYDMALIGGDTNESQELTLCGTCIGMVEKNTVLTKSGAIPGDYIAVTGYLGLAAAGFKVLSDPQYESINENPFKELIIKHALEPEAKLKQGISLAKSCSVSSATDISDGLLSELGELIDANDKKIGMVITQNDLPIPQGVFEIASIKGSDPLEMAISYGEDFEILLTISPQNFDNLKTKFKLFKIGVVDSSGVIKMIDKAGKTNIITPKGYEHLK